MTPAVLQLQPGLNSAAEAGQAGKGVIGFALSRGIPVLHMLNIKTLAGQAGIPYDSEPRKQAPLAVSSLVVPCRRPAVFHRIADPQALAPGINIKKFGAG